MRTQQEVSAMHCPVCRVPLSMSDRQGIEIDYCPKCRGVWLDRGELDKLIAAGSPESPPSRAPDVRNREPQYREQRHYPEDGSYGYGKKRKKSFLGDLFDFD